MILKAVSGNFLRSSRGSGCYKRGERERGEVGYDIELLLLCVCVCERERERESESEEAFWIERQLMGKGNDVF